MAIKGCKGKVLGNSALQDIFNACVLSRLKSLESPSNSVTRYDYTGVSGTSSTIGYSASPMHIVGCQNTSETTITLDPISSTGKLEITVKDEALNDSSGNIIINPNASDSIEGNTTLIIQRNGSKKGSSVTLYNDNNNDWYIK